MYASLSGPIAVSGALGATEEDALDELPTKGEVKANYKSTLDLAPPDFPGATKSPEEAIGWSRTALDNYARRRGIDTGSSRHRDLALMVSTSGQGRGLDINNPNYSDYAGALADITGASSVKEYGIAVELGVVTYDMVKDGKFSDKDAEKVGQVTGAVVGGIVAQAFGVPAPIGAAAGAAVGGGVANIVYNVFGGVDLQEQAKQQAKQARHAAKLFREDAIYRCRGLESAYWDEVNGFFDRFAVAWTKAELETGWRFGLRWFDPNPGLEFRYTWNRSASRVTTAPRSDTLGIEYACQQKVIVHSQGQERFTSCKYRCPFVYGCPYPDLGTKAVPGRIVPAAITADDQRVAQAFASRGVIWRPPSQRIDCAAHIKRPPTSNLATNPDLLNKWKADVGLQLSNIERRMNHFMQARTLLQADLLRTLAVVQTEREIYARRAEFLTDGWKAGTYDEAIKQSQRLSRVLNTAVFVGGGSLLGYALWRALR